MEKSLVALGLKYIAKKSNGYKTYMGACGTAILGLIVILNSVVNILSALFPDTIDGVPAIPIEDSLDNLLIGCGMITTAILGAGIGHKVEKNSTK